MVAAILTGAAWGFLNATIIVFGRINPIIVTLGSNFAGIAVLLLIFQSAQTPLHSGLSHFGQGYFLGLPRIFWPMVVLVLVVGLLCARPVTGVGPSASVETRRGQVPRHLLRKTRFGIFTAAGGLSGWRRVLFTSSNASFGPNDGASTSSRSSPR